MRRFAWLFLFGLVFNACGGDEPIDQTLDQTLWSLVSIADSEIDIEPSASIGFGEGEIGGTTGCNTFGGSYRVVPDADTISIGPLRSTLAACPSNGLAARERAMMASLQVAVRYRITSEGLEFLNANGEVLSAYDTVEPALTGTTWTVIGYNTGTQAVRSVIGDTELTLEFDESETVSGSSGCNTFSGIFETNGEYTVVGGQTLSIGEVATTKAACAQPEGVMDQESQILAALVNSDLWRLVGSNLELRDGEGALQVLASPGT
jgi:heat shock protein HslJ